MDIGIGILLALLTLVLAWMAKSLRQTNLKCSGIQETNHQLFFEKEHLKEKYSTLQENHARQLALSENQALEYKKLEQEKYQLTIEKNTLTNQLHYLNEKLVFQKQELEKVGEKFQKEFELLANKILEEKSRKFSLQNQENIGKILDPLGKDLAEFKKQVQETYSMESKERFSLEKKVKELAELNQQISQEAKNLTNALKGNSKIRGNWGEAILETILQHSGLERDRHYSVQEFLKDEAGQPILGMDGKKMQPDVIIHYPDNKKVIVDSKISLMAYERYCSGTEESTQKADLNAHLKAIKTHIDQLSSKQYEAYSKVLDFVIMFIPLEAAYITALQGDPQIWEYAYKKRVLLISSSNLIAALKMIKDLWIRVDQSKYAMEIAERGGRMYDKFAAFLGNLEDIGKNLEKSQDSYQLALKQLKTGKGNLVSQAEKLRTLGINAKTKIPEKLIS
ncbi:MAG: DNA recombination protein RmuC [Cyclobacteriaceae bacterium]